MRRFANLKFVNVVVSMFVLQIAWGCGGNTAGVNRPAITVAIMNPWPASVQVGATANIAATVSNDPANKGVSWTCAPASSCGSFTPAQTATGAKTVYSAPANVPQGGSVTITATSLSDSTKTSAVNVTITPAISVSITTAPSASMQTNATASVAATVYSDSAGNGVTWSCSPSASCGSFVPMQTASGVATTYTAPASVPPGGNVVITATSVTDTTKSASATIAITSASSNASLSGQYAFLLNGQNNLGNYTIVGSLTLDGNGKITAGEQDLMMMSGPYVADPLTGTYAVGANGRGTMALTTLNFTETFAFTITSPAHALLIEDDGNGTASGVLDLQRTAPTFTAAQFSGAFSFTLAGEDELNAMPTIFGGVFTADGAGKLASGTLDENDAGVFTTKSFTGTFTSPDKNGRGTITFGTGATFTYYLVSPKIVQLVETDINFVAGGTAYSQGAASTFTNASLTGRFVFDNFGSIVAANGSFAAAGQFVTDGNGNVTAGLADANDNGTSTSGSLVGTKYAFNNSPRGTFAIPAGTIFTNGMNFSAYLVDPQINVLDPNSTTGGGGALLLTNDANHYGIGIIVPQVSPAPSTVVGNYAINLISAPGTSKESDLVGQVVADSSGNIAGTADFAHAGQNSTKLFSNNASYTGTVVPDKSNAGRFTGTFLVPGGTIPFVSSGATENLSYYQADAAQGFVIDTTARGTVVAGVFVEQ